jgi:hypothetical protein
MLKNGTAVVNQISKKRQENGPNFSPLSIGEDFVKNYTIAVLTFLFTVGQYPSDGQPPGPDDAPAVRRGAPEAVMLPGDPRDMRRYFAFSQVGLEMVVPIVAGVLLDLWLHWMPWGVLTGVVLGLTVGFVHLIYLVKKEDSDSSPPKPGQRESR